MSISPKLMYAILSMDAYNRGYEPGIEGLGGLLSQIGPATLITDSETIPATQGEGEAGDFYAVAYEWNGETVISYRGTDEFDDEVLGVDLPIALRGDFDEAEIHLASKFYREIAGTTGTSAITLTGHSLGGGLAGFVGGVYDQYAVGFASIGFTHALQNFQALMDQYATVKDSPSLAATDEIFFSFLQNPFLPNSGYVNTYEFAQAQLSAMGIPSNEVLSFGGTYEGWHATGEAAIAVRIDGTPSTEILGTELPNMGDMVNVANAHTINLTVILQYLKEQGSEALKFLPIIQPLFLGLFDDAVAKKAGSEETSGVSGPAARVRDAIAYSILEEGMVFGNTGIRALFNDADQLGRLTAEGKVPVAHANPIPGLAEAVVQFAGQMARGKVNYTNHPDWNPQTGFLSTYDSQGVTYLKADLAEELWTLNDVGGDNDHPDVEIKGITTILNSFFAQEEEAALILAAMNTLYGSNEHTTIDRIDFALGSGSLTVALQERGDDEESGGSPPPYNPETTSLFVALNGDDEVDGNSDNNMLVGGAGDDILYGRLGRDIIVGGTGSDRIIDIVGEVGSDGRSNEDDVYFGEPSDQGLWATFLAWLLGTQSEDTVEYRLTDERQGTSPPSSGVEITRLDVAENFGEEVVTLDLKNLNSGKTGTDYLVNIDKVILSERRDEVVVNPAWLDVPLWVDLGKATNGVVTKSDYDRVSYENLGGLVTVNGATQPGGSNGPVTDRSYIKLIIDLVASALDFPVPVTPVLSAFTSNDPLRVSGAEHVELTNADDTLWYGPISHAVGFLTGWPDDADYPTFGIIDGKGGHDILVVRNAKYVFAGDPLHPEEPNSAVAGQDLNLEVRGGPGSDQLMVIGGIGAEVVGGPGTDLLFNYSYKGKLYGGRKDGTGDDETDIFWWSSSNSFIMDAGKNDLLQMYGVTLTGGTNSAYGLAANYGNNVKDWLLPFVRYGATDGGQLLIYTTWSGPDNATIVEDYDYGGFEEELLGIAKPGDLGMLFRIYGGDDLEVRLFYVVWGHLATFIEALWTFAKGLQWKTHDDPLVLDLDGDGIETSTPEQGGVHFDLDNDFFSEKTGWVKADDGLLVWDQDGNRRIDDSTELFGSPGTDGFTELAALDDNADGVIDANDANFTNLEVWRDLNQDGRTDQGELFTLAELDITSLGAVGTAFNHTTPNGNLLREHATFTRGDGTTGNIYEAIFQNDQIDTQFRGERGLAEWERSAHTERIAA